MAEITTKSNKTYSSSKGAHIFGTKKPGSYNGYVLPNHDMNSLKEKEIQKLIDTTNAKGRMLTDDEVLAIVGDTMQSDNKIAYYHHLVDTNADLFGFDSTGTSTNTSEISEQEAAYNAYYNDLYSLEPGTLGREMLDQFTESEQRAAISNMQLAEAQYQQAAMQQAEVVKSITDSVKAERMARLRAGMSEAQIANQDMQVMLNNMNTLNKSMSTMEQNRLAAQQQYTLAQDTAYQQYLQQVTGIGQTSAAMAASDAGDAYMQTLKRMKATGEAYKQANKSVVNPTS